MSDLETLRKALDIMERAQRSGLKADEWTTFKTARVLQAAARRFLALTETGPDYEAAYKAFWETFEVQGVPNHRTVRAAVDAALADYLEDNDA